MSKRSLGGLLLASGLGALVGVSGGYLLGANNQGIDWQSTGSMMQGVAALLAALAAAWGVNRWQEELRYKRNSELAEKTLILVEGLSRALMEARADPFDFEIDTRIDGGPVLVTSFYEYRYRRLTEGGQEAELRALRDRVFAIFGQKHSEALDKLAETTAIIRTCLSECARTTAAVDHGMSDPDSLQKLAETSSIVFSIDEKGRDMSEAIKQRISEVRRLFRDAI